MLPKSTPPFFWPVLTRNSHSLQMLYAGPRNRGRLERLRDDLGWVPLETDEDKRWVPLLLHWSCHTPVGYKYMCTLLGWILVPRICFIVKIITSYIFVLHVDAYVDVKVWSWIFGCACNSSSLSSQTSTASSWTSSGGNVTFDLHHLVLCKGCSSSWNLITVNKKSTWAACVCQEHCLAIYVLDRSLIYSRNVGFG